MNDIICCLSPTEITALKAAYLEGMSISRDAFKAILLRRRDYLITVCVGKVTWMTVVKPIILLISGVGNSHTFLLILLAWLSILPSLVCASNEQPIEESQWIISGAKLTSFYSYIMSLICHCQLSQLVMAASL